MDKKKYYVSVQSKSLLENQGDDAYELEIEATDEEASMLRRLLEGLDETEHATFFRGMTPGLPYHWDRENDAYDAALRQIYRTIHALGTPETKTHMASMEPQFATFGHDYE